MAATPPGARKLRAHLDRWVSTITDSAAEADGRRARELDLAAAAIEAAISAGAEPERRSHAA